MKKLFTLIATALVALSANADPTWSWTWSGTAPTDNKETLEVANYGTVNIVYEVGAKTDVFSSASGVKFSGGAVTMTITLPEGKYFTDGDKFSVVTKGANSSADAQLSVGGQLTTVHAASTTEEITSEIELPSTFAASNSITISRTGSGTLYLKSLEFTSTGKTPTVTTEWNFSKWDADATGVTTGTTVKNNLGIAACNPNGETPTLGSGIGIIDGSNKTIGGVKYTQRFKMNGAGFSGEVTETPAMPTQRFVYFAVTGPSTVYIAAVTGSSGQTRNVVLSDGTNIIGKVACSASAGDEGTLEYTGGAGTLYIYCEAGCHLFDIKATNVGTTTEYTWPTAINEVNAAPAKAANNAVVKTINGIYKNGKKYNFAGQQMK